MPAIEGEAAVVGARIVVEPEAPRVGIAEPDVVALLQRVGEAAAPPAGHPFDQRYLHRPVVAVELLARLRLEHAPEVGAARHLGNQRSIRVERRHAWTHTVHRLVDVDHAKLIAGGVGDIVHRYRRVVEQLVIDAQAPGPLVRHLPVWTVDARISTERGPRDDLVAQPVQFRLASRADRRDTRVACRIGDHHRTQHRAVRVGDRQRRKLGQHAGLLVHEIEHHRHVGVELTQAAAHHRLALAGHVPRKTDARRDVVLAGRRVPLIVVADTEVQRQVVADAELVLHEKVVTAIFGSDGVAERVRWPHGDVELERVGREVGGVVRRVGPELEGARADRGPRRHLVEADASACLEGVLAAQQTRYEVAERLVEDVGADNGLGGVSALARDVAWMDVELADREGIPSSEPDGVHVVIEEGLGAGGQLLADAADANHVRDAVVQDRCVGAADQMIPVVLPLLCVERRVVGVESFAPRRSGLEHPPHVDEVAVVDLHVSAAEIVTGPDLEGPDEIAREWRRRCGKPLLPSDILAVLFHREIEVGAVLDDRAAKREAGLQGALVWLRRAVWQEVAAAVEPLVAKVGVDAAAERVGSAPRDHVDDGAGAAAILGAVLVGQHLILLDVVQHHAYLRALTAAQAVVVVVHAVDQVDVLLRRRAISHDLTALEGGGRGVGRHAGNELRERREVAEVRRHILDLPAGQAAADLVAGLLHERRLPRDQHGFLEPGHLHLHFERDHRSRGEDDVGLFDGAEPRHLHHQREHTGLEVGY